MRQERAACDPLNVLARGSRAGQLTEALWVQWWTLEAKPRLCASE